MRNRILHGGLTLLLVLGLPAIASPQDLPKELPARQWRQGALNVELQPLLMDQTRAFFLGRGFPQAAANDLARRGCVFRASIGNVAANNADPALDLDLSAWRVETSGASRSFPRQDDWDKEWEKASVPEGARIAFRWALFPPSQTFAPGDYNWGMLTFEQPAGTRFTLSLQWSVKGAPQEGRIENLECPPNDR